jgi:cysteine desulfurase/selenocysteine lyase
MNTSDPGDGGLGVNPAGASGAADPRTLVDEIAALANQLFSGVPAGAAPSPLLSHAGPTLLTGGGGPAAALPPVPGPALSPPIANAPAPPENQLRAMPVALGQGLGLELAVPLAQMQPSSGAPYFLEIAGVPAYPTAAPQLPSSALAHTLPEPGGGAAPSGAAPLASDRSAPHLDAVSSSPNSPHRRHDDAGSSLPTAFSGYDFRPELVPDVPQRGSVFDAHAIKRDFPILQERVHNRPLVWLDNAATTQKPRAVIDRLSYFYEHENSNVHRAAHALAARATDAYEGARDKVRRFLGAPSPKEIVFVRGGTEAINLVAQSWGRRNVGADDEIVITWLEHHANIVPWQQLAKEKGARLRVAPVDDRGQVLLEDFERLLGPRTRLVAITQVSNALGTVVPVREMTQIAHRYGTRVLVDGAQAVSHMPVDVQDIDCDFYCFSGHKVFGPTGIGALYAKPEVLEAMPPWQGGGNMIADVTFERTVYQPPPWRFEAGTGNIADAVGLGAAIDYVSAIGMSVIERYEHDLLVYATGRLAEVPGLRMLGTAPEKAGVLSFVLDGARSEDVGTALDQEGIAVRSGHHCAQPILRRFGVESSIRASLALYNTCADIDALVDALLRIQSGRPRRGP